MASRLLFGGLFPVGVGAEINPDSGGIVYLFIYNPSGRLCLGLQRFLGLTLHAEITPSGAKGTIWDAGIEQGGPVPGKFPTCWTICLWPPPSFFF